MKFCVSSQPHVFLMRSLAHQCLTNMLTLWELTGNSLRKYVGMNQFSLTNSLSLSFSLLRQVMECGLSLLMRLLPSFLLVYAWPQPLALSQARLG